MNATEQIPDVIEETIRAASAEGLLRAFASLTHRLHEAASDRSDEDLQSLREQRDRLQAEILRRMGEAR